MFKVSQVILISIQFGVAVWITDLMMDKELRLWFPNSRYYNLFTLSSFQGLIFDFLGLLHCTMCSSWYLMQHPTHKDWILLNFNPNVFKKKTQSYIRKERENEWHHSWGKYIFPCYLNNWISAATWKLSAVLFQWNKK